MINYHSTFNGVDVENGDQVAFACCSKHWEMMHAAISDRGMGHLISKGPAEAEAMAKKIQDEGPEAFTDPLMESFTKMTVALMEMVGPEDLLRMYAHVEHKPICPICAAMVVGKEGHASTENHWTNNLADHMLTEYRERGLVTRLQ